MSKSLKDLLSGDAKSFVKMLIGAFVILFLVVVAYLVLIYPIAKDAISSRLVPLNPQEDVAEESVSKGYGGSAPQALTSDARIGIVPPSPTDSFYVGDGVEQRIIKNGNLDLQVESVEESIDDISQLAEEKDGFVQNSNISEDRTGKKFGSVSIRVPETEFLATMSDLKALAERVISENTSGQDVTQEFVDLESQVQHLEAVEDRYLELLEQAENVEEILQVQDRLNNTQQQLDWAKGRLQNLENVTSYSQIYVNLSQGPQVKAPVDKFDLGTTFEEGIQTLIRILQNFLVFVIVFFFVAIGLIPYLLLIGLIAWLGKKGYDAYQKNNKKKNRK